MHSRGRVSVQSSPPGAATGVGEDPEHRAHCRAEGGQVRRGPRRLGQRTGTVPGEDGLAVLLRTFVCQRLGSAPRVNTFAAMRATPVRGAETAQ